MQEVGGSNPPSPTIWMPLRPHHAMPTPASEAVSPPLPRRKPSCSGRCVHLALGAFAVTVGFLIRKTTATIRGRRPHSIGTEIDQLHGISVHDNGETAHTLGRHLAPDGYNLGIRYQCVEFVKRYYYEYLGHRMPDTYGHAKDFFDPAVSDGEINARRNLVQFTNGSHSRPAPDDLLVFRPTLFNRYGHVAILAEVTESEVEFIQQNPGPLAPSRERFPLRQTDKQTWKIDHALILGWLRKS